MNPEELGRVPNTGETVVVGAHELEILEVDETRVLQLRFL